MSLIYARSGQVIDAPVIHTDRGLDLTDKRFGRLVALRVVDTSKDGNVWLCQCDCGSVALRTASRLQDAMKHGRAPECNECKRARWRRHWETVKAKRVAKLSSMRREWLVRARLGESLYSDAFDYLETETIIKCVESSCDVEFFREEPLQIWNDQIVMKHAVPFSDLEVAHQSPAKRKRAGVDDAEWELMEFRRISREAIAEHLATAPIPNELELNDDMIWIGEP